jgi:hypothetical protein
MGLKPWEFDRLTPPEFARMLKGYQARQEQEWYRTAWLACYILAPHSKRKLTPEKLLGLQPKSDATKKVRLVVGQQKSEVTPSES